MLRPQRGPMDEASVHLDKQCSDCSMSLRYHLLIGHWGMGMDDVVCTCVLDDA